MLENLDIQNIEIKAAVSTNAGPGTQNLPIAQANSGVTIIDQEQAPLIRNLSIEIDKLLSDEEEWSDQ